MIKWSEKTRCMCHYVGGCKCKVLIETIIYTVIINYSGKESTKRTKKDIGHTMATSIPVTLSSSSGQTRYPRRTHSRYDVTLAKSWALWKETESR